jgi:hypothetical protein
VTSALKRSADTGPPYSSGDLTAKSVENKWLFNGSMTRWNRWTSVIVAYAGFSRRCPLSEKSPTPSTKLPKTFSDSDPDANNPDLSGINLTNTTPSNTPYD